MKAIHLLASAAALLATAACNGGDKGNQTSADTNVSSAPVAPPEGGDWSQVVTKTAEGGFVMGNPNAEVKLIEFGSMTCSHCATFDQTAVKPLVDNYVKAGQVAYEFRNYVRESLDLTASLIARCNGEKSFFPLTHAMFKDQQQWMGKVQTATPEQLQALGTLGPAQQFLEFAKLSGLQQWAAMRGVPTAKSTACLTNETEINQLVQMNSDATSAFNPPGTPAFVINGELVDGASWEALEPKIKEALS